MVVDRLTNLPIPFAIIKIYFASLNKEVAHAVSDITGRYYKLIASGTYYVTVDKKNDDGSYTTVYKSAPMDIKNGVINQNFIV